MTADIVKNLFCMFSAVGAGAEGMAAAQVEVAGMHGRWQCLGGIDIDAQANRVFERRLGVRAMTRDLMDREQYLAFHGHEPPPGWIEATPADIRAAAQHRRPHAVFLSAPCKGFSGLLSETKSKTDKYQALNRLTLRGVWLMLEAWPDDPPDIILFENVPRLATRGRVLLDRITAMLRAYGYVVAETTHDCGELAGLAQHRKRFLLVARRLDKVPNFLYEPPKRPLRAVGEILQHLPLAGDPRGGVMHRLPALQWRTWVRLAFVEAGKDWRSLNRLAVEDGLLRDYLMVPTMHRGGYGVRRWDEATGVVASESRPSNGAFSVADIRLAPNDFCGFRVVRWDRAAGTVTSGSCSPGSNTQSLADPRHHGAPKHSNEFRVTPWVEPTGSVTGAHGSGHCVSDPRPSGPLFGKYEVADWGGAARTVISGSTSGNGAYALADPRSGLDAQRGAYLTGGHYGVVPWEEASGAVSATACHDNGRWSLADPRTSGFAPTSEGEKIDMPAIDQKLVCRIISDDGTWHRPFTTLELGALQSLYDPEDPLELAAFTCDYTAESGNDSMHREWIGNAVPRAAALAIGTEILRTLMLADAGETFALSSTPIWVRPVVTALTLAQGGVA